MQKIFDTHIHLYDAKQLDMPWLDEVPALKKVYTYTDYQQATEGFDVQQIAYVEVDVAKSGLQQEADVALALSAEHKDISALVLGADLTQTHFADYITPLSKHKNVVGIRHVGLGFESADVYYQQHFIDNVKLAGKLGLMVELLPQILHIEAANHLVEQCPETRFVINHCGFISSREQDTSLKKFWQQGMRNYSQQANTLCKISGLLQNEPDGEWTPADLAPIVNFCLDTFGEDRVVFASNWPVCDLNGGFARWVHALEEIVTNRGRELKDKLFYNNALRYYKQR